MTRWLVKVLGERVDLEEFLVRFPDGGVYPVERDGGVYLTGPELDALTDAEQVREHAKGAAEEMSAICSLLWPPFEKPSIGHVLREDDQGGTSAWIFAETISARSKASVEMTMIRKDGSQETISSETERPTVAQNLLNSARATVHLRTAVLLWGFPDHAWWLLYRILEDIEAHLSETGRPGSVAAVGYCTSGDRRRFKHSANSGKASGLLARHAVDLKPPPKNPMSLDLARTFVKALLECALRDVRV